MTKSEFLSQYPGIKKRVPKHSLYHLVYPEQCRGSKKTGTYTLSGTINGAR